MQGGHFYSRVGAYNLMAALDQNDLALLMRLTKRGNTLDQMCKTLSVDKETVLDALAIKVGITTKIMGRVIVLREQSHSLEEISDLCSAPLESLKEIFPSDLPTDLIFQIITLSKEGHTPEDISRNIGIPVADILQVLLKSHPNRATSVVSSKIEPSKEDEVTPLLNSKESQQRVLKKIGSEASTVTVDGCLGRACLLVISEDAEPPMPSAAANEASHPVEVKRQAVKEVPRLGRAILPVISEDAEPPMPSAAANKASHPVEVKRQGTKTWPNGDFYEGELVNEEPHGAGKMRYSNARTYVGEWVRGKMQG
jgi:hypothetical protein